MSHFTCTFMHIIWTFKAHRLIVLNREFQCLKQVACEKEEMQIRTCYFNVSYIYILNHMKIWCFCFLYRVFLVKFISYRILHLMFMFLNSKKLLLDLNWIFRFETFLPLDLDFYAQTDTYTHECWHYRHVVVLLILLFRTAVLNQWTSERHPVGLVFYKDT